MMLLMPWGKEDEDGPTINLPAEYFLLLPLLAHRRLFGDFERQVAMPLASCVSRPMCEWWSTHPGAPNHRKTGDGLHTITSHRVRLRVAGGQASRVDIPARPRAGRRHSHRGITPVQAVADVDRVSAPARTFCVSTWLAAPG